nr:DUF4199 domain-containing protein [uncultured Prevotella sp.]
MIHDEFKQLTAYTRYDGIYLAVIWTASFACLLGMTILPVLAQFSFLLSLSSPFFVAYRLKIFREEGRNGVISYRRSLFYCVRVFFNAALIFSLLQWLYMHYIDKGRLVMMVTNVYSSDEGKGVLTALGVPYDQFISVLPEAFQPYSLASTSFVYALILGGICSLFIAALMSKKKR